MEGVADSGEVLTVYNFRIAEYHTYFVGGDEWGFDVWAHNAEYRVGDTAPQLPRKVIARRGELRIEHYYHGGNDHGPAHLHIYQGKSSTRIGANGRPGIFPGDSELTPQMEKFVANNRSQIRSAVNRINRWITYMRQVHGGIQHGS